LTPFPTTRQTVGALLAERLAAAGVTTVFGFPGGGSNLDLIDAFADAGVRFVLTHTETGAALMAAGQAEATGGLGAAMVGNGPGVTSVVTGVAHADLDRVPLVVISDRYTEEEAATTGHQVLDQRALMAPLVRSGATLSAGRAAEQIDAAIAAARGPVPGPVHLDVPRTLAAEEAAPAQAAPEDAAPAHEAPAREVPPVPLAAVDPGPALELLRTAARPVVVLGLEANAPDVDAADVRRLVEAAGAAVLTTYKAKGAFDERHERWAGILTGGAIERPVLDAADAVLLIGVDPVELLGRPWTLDVPTVQIRRSPTGTGYFGAAELMLGDVGAAVAGVADALGHGAGWPPEGVTRLRERALAAMRVGAELPLPGWRIAETIAQTLEAADVTFAVDAGAHMLPATMFLRPRAPRRFLISNGLATMGYALPAAVGAALDHPERLTVAVAGDGGMAFHLAELETSARIGARVVVVVFNDASLSLIRIKQEAKGRERSPLDFTRSDFAAAAAAFGAVGARVDDVAGLVAALRAAAERPQSTLIDVQTTGAEAAETLKAVRG
jgi:acetolactate synthase-1/2/3 large subunit